MANHLCWNCKTLYLSVLLTYIFLAVVSSKTVSFDDPCSQVQCPTEASLCPPDSVKRQPTIIAETLFGPDEYLPPPPHEFYDEADDPADVVEEHYDEFPVHLSADTIQDIANPDRASNSATNSTTNQLLESADTKVSDAEKDTASVLVKRELSFDNEHFYDFDEHEHLLDMCCPTEENRRRRRRRTIVPDDCKCKPCGAILQCPTGEVAIKLHEASGSPGDCCPQYACAPKPKCGETANVQPYWRDSCTRCSCYGLNDLELCHNECPQIEEPDIQGNCYSTYLQEPMLHGSEWFENDYCTKCRCENGERDCVSSLCIPLECSNPIKVPGKCCPQCLPGGENILIAHENSTDTSISISNKPELRNVTETSYTMDLSSTNFTTADTSATTEYSTTAKTFTESTTLPISTQTASTEATTTELIYSSTSTSQMSTSSTEIFTTTRRIDDIAADAYFGPNSTLSNSAMNSSITSTEQTIDSTSESLSQSPIASQPNTSLPTQSNQEEATEATTTHTVSTSSQIPYTESSTEVSTTSTENTVVIVTNSSTLTFDSTSTVTAATAFETSTVTPTTSSTSESSTNSNSKPNESTTPQLDPTTNVTTPSSSTASTASSVTDNASSTQNYSLTTNSPYSSTTSTTTSTTSSPFTSTLSTQVPTTIVYWYTFSTSAPSPPMPQPTVYQPSVRTFLTRPEVRYIGVTVFFTFLAICALAVWKFCKPTRSTRQKNHYRTVPSSEATSLSHSPTTSHSSMA